MATDMTQGLSNDHNIPSSTAPMTGNQERQAVNEHFYGPSPKMMTFDGKVNWKAFRLQFEEMAATYHWTEELNSENLKNTFVTKLLFSIQDNEREYEETSSSFEIVWRDISEDRNHRPRYTEDYRILNKWLMSPLKILPTKLQLGSGWIFRCLRRYYRYCSFRSCPKRLCR